MISVSESTMEAEFARRGSEYRIDVLSAATISRGRYWFHEEDYELLRRKWSPWATVREIPDFVQAMLDSAAGRFVTDEQFSERMRICGGCSWRRGEGHDAYCGACTCRERKSARLTVKGRIVGAVCGKGNWPDVST